jgi:glycosyltransferase involved in cell wall biosynthesis
MVVHCRDLLPPGLAAEAVRRLVLASSEEVVAVSRTAAARLAGPRWAQRHVTVIDNPVDTERFDPERLPIEAARRALELTGTPVLGLVAQITPWKGHTRAVRILAGLREEHPGAELVIAGEAKFVTPSTRFDNQAYERELRDLVGELRLTDAVRFLGERQDAEQVMASLDVLLVPSTEEPFGRTVIEAMAMGVPVIATDVGGPSEILRDGRDGVVLPPDELEAWVRAASSLARRGRRQESREYATERFSSQRHAAAVISVYEQVLARNGAAQRRTGA